MKKVSIIVTTYNDSKFLDKCMNQIRKQTYKNFEVIVCDDGSSDSTIEQANLFKDKIEHLKIISHENVGLSENRNIALKYCTGDFVTFVDVDDYLDKDFLEKMLVGNEEYDFIIGGYRRVFEDGSVQFEYNSPSSVWGNYMRCMVWAKLYNLNFLKSNDIFFPHCRIYGEDVVYTIRVLSCSPKTKILQFVGYNNLINESSITHTQKKKLKNDVTKIIKHIDNFIGNNKDYIDNNQEIIKFYYLKLFSNFLIEQVPLLSKKELVSYFDNLKYIKYIFQKYGYKFSVKSMKGERKQVNFFIKIVVIMDKLHLNNLLINLLKITFR